MRYFEYTNAHTSLGGGPTRGIDIRAPDAVAQVKPTVGSAGKPIVLQIYGIAQVEGLSAYAFSLGGLTTDAVDWANRAKVEFLLRRGFPSLVSVDGPAGCDLLGSGKAVSGLRRQVGSAADTSEHEA
jgi:hypothetical protein